MGVKITDKDMGFKKFVSDISKLKKKPFVKFGILASIGSKKKKNSKKLTVLEVGVYNEFGTNRIPSRPFIRTTYDENKEKYFLRLKTIMSESLNANGALEMVGLEAVSDTKNLIKKTHGSWAPNSPATIRRKKSDKPLIDTGQLLNSIQHKVVNTKTI